ncbi:MAG: hypothetical protein JSS66_06860 [Armatimonadetes bacterium]|nr:hypothetical protein [Armatimonadota bacterium]
MRVIKSGSGAQAWSIKAKCTGKGNRGGGCGAQLSVEAGDLFRTFSSHYDGSSETYVTFECPECKVWTDLENKDRPPNSGKLPNKTTWDNRQKRLARKAKKEDSQ